MEKIMLMEAILVVATRKGVLQGSVPSFRTLNPELILNWSCLSSCVPALSGIQMGSVKAGIEAPAGLSGLSP